MEAGQPPTAPAPGWESARLGAAIAGGGGLLLFVSLFVPWYTEIGGQITDVPVIGDVIQGAGEAVGRDVRDEATRTGWESFEITDIVCAFAALVAVIRAAMAIFGRSDNPEVPGAVLTLALGGVALAMVAYRVVNPPSFFQERQIGVWLALLAAGAIVYGSYVAMQSGKQRL